MSVLHELTRELAAELNSCGHDISDIDLLDALASTGLTLTTIDTTEASEAYIEALDK